MAEVFLAAWEAAPRVRRPVIIKRLYAHFGDDPAVFQMFMDEARLVCCLEHENIVKTLEVGVLDGQCCIAMEYLAGQPLQRLMRRCRNSGGLPINLAVHIIIGVLEALEYAHDAKDHQGRPLEIVHRDISPQNIFVTNTGLVKVLDFGIAKAKSHEGRTEAGLVKGKFAYLAPEQACAQKVDRRADVWSVGVVLWEMLSGTRLFRSDNEAATLRATLRAEIPRVSTLRSEVDSDLDRILLRALQRHPNLRCQNASEMMGELQNYLSSTHQSPDNSALATLIHEMFPDEIVEQHRLVHELMHASESSLSETTPAPTSANATPAASESAISMEFSRIDGLLQELAKRHRVVLHTVLVTLFALVAVASFFVCFFLTRNNRPPNPSPLLNSATTLMPATSAVQPRPDLTNDNKLTNEELMLPAVGSVAGDADTTSASCVSPAVTVQGLLSEAPRNWATQPSTAAGESSASAPIVVRKLYKSKTRVSKRDYGI